MAAVSMEQGDCAAITVRKEWRALADDEKARYISAVQCLMRHPSMYREGTSYYDDFIFAHSMTGSSAHYVATFLPWHRYYMYVYEQALRQKCGYQGSFP